MSNRVSDTILKRIYWLVGFLGLATFLIVAKVVKIQYADGEKWRNVAANQKVYPKSVLADRGSILADDQSVMAVTLPFYRFAMDATVLKERNFVNLQDSLYELCDLLAEHFGRQELTSGHFLKKILQARDNNDRHIYLFPVSRRFTYQDYKLIRTFPILNRGRFVGGFIVEKVNNKRFYPLGSLAKITLGRLKDDTTGLKGIEYSFNQLLRGSDGKRMVQRLAGGVEVPVDYFSEMSAEDGYDILTTININMQDVAYNALRRCVEDNDAKWGVAILMETRTGHIKALANYPENFNYGVAMQYEPGSTFKIASAMAALEDGVIRPGDSIQTGEDGYVTYYEDDVMRDERSYGNLTLRQALEKSSNIAISRVIFDNYRRRPEAFIEQLEAIGILSNTSFQLKGEPEPYIIRPGNTLWSGITLPWLSIGYNVKLTPLQLLTFYNGIANGGKMIQPILVKEIRDGGEVYRSYESRVLREQMCSPATLQYIQRSLEDVVESGTAKNIHSETFPIAGKTGTAKKLINGSYQSKYMSSFVGYFPADNPQYTCIVLINEPSGDQFYGAKIAAPVFREIAEHVFSTRVKENFRPVITDAEAQTDYPLAAVAHQQDANQFYKAFGIPTPESFDHEYVSTQKKGSFVGYRAVEFRKGKTPDVRGMSSRNALAVLENLGFRVKLRGHGRVRKQSIPPGMRYRRGSLITLTLAHQE